jgi:hypothetical protein
MLYLPLAEVTDWSQTLLDPGTGTVFRCLYAMLLPDLEEFPPTFPFKDWFPEASGPLDGVELPAKCV